MPKFHVTATVTATAYVGVVEADTAAEAWKKGQELCKPIKSKYVESRDLDENRCYFEDLESVEPDDGSEYVPAKWR